MLEELFIENYFEDVIIGMNIFKNFIFFIEKVINDVCLYFC